MNSSLSCMLIMFFLVLLLQFVILLLWIDHRLYLTASVQLRGLMYSFVGRTEGLFPNLSDQSLPSSNHMLMKANESSNVIIAGLGDVLLTNSLATECKKVGSYKYLWEDVAYLWREYADFSFANFEGTTGTVDKDGKLISGREGLNRNNKAIYTNSVSSGGFNYHPDLAHDIAASGISIVSTANNHAFDRGFKGIKETISVLEANGLIQVGSIHPGISKNESKNRWYKLSKKKNTTIAWIGCTNFLCSTCRSGLRASEERVRLQILFCDEVPNLIKFILQNERVNAIIVAAHWDAQFRDEPSNKVKKLAKTILDAGATAIIGNHPHVLQGSRYYTTRDGRRTFVCYSLGSLSSGLGLHPIQVKRRTSAVVFIELERASPKFGGRVSESHSDIVPFQVAKVKFVPICEVWTKTKTRKVIPGTAYEQGQCKRESAWAIHHLGEDEYISPPPRKSSN